jgi:glucosylceramidase
MTFISVRRVARLSAWLALPLLVNLASCKSDDKDPVTPYTPPVTPVAGDVTAWLTTPDLNGSRLSRQLAAINFRASAVGATTPIIEVDKNQQFQPIDGFGAAVTGSTAYLLQRKMTGDQRAALLRDLYTTANDGIGLSYARMTIGSSDFSIGTYSYDDVPAGQTDPTLANFSIDRDRAELLPTLQEIIALNPQLKLMGSPWSPPAWMKSTQNMIGGQLNPSAYPAYAQYFVKFVQAFGAAGVSFDAITIQNEPLFEPPGYPGMAMSAAQQADFIKNHLGPAFRTNGIATKIIAYDHNWDRADYPLAVLADAGAAQYVAGSAFHGYAGNVEAMGTVHDAHPNKDLYFTEQSGGEFAPGFANNLRDMTRTLIIGTTRNWSRNVLLWNLALDENYGPTNGGCQNCTGVVKINSATGAVTKNVEYYALGHASKFVRPGAHRIASSVVSNLPNVAFLNADGSTALIVLNETNTTQTVWVKAANDKYFSYNLQAGAVVTLVWNA